jgi:hypothetical protein
MPARKTKPEDERREITLTVQQWRWLADSARFNLTHRSRSDKIDGAMAQALTRLIQAVEPKLAGKKDKDAVTLTPLVTNAVQIAEYLMHVPGALNVGSDLARQVRV